MNKTNKRLRYLALLLLIFGVTFTSLAYFTSKTENLTNKFISGQVTIELTEPNYKTFLETNPNPVLLPGATYPKDPTVTLGELNSDAYVFMAVENKLLSTTGETLVKTMAINPNWEVIENSEFKSANPNTTVYKFHKVVKSGDTLDPLFETVIMKNFVNEDVTAGQQLDIIISAYAHQASTLTTTEGIAPENDLIKSATESAFESFSVKP